MRIYLNDSKNYPVKDNVLLDTNVLYWLTYANSRVFPKALKAKDYQLKDYPLLFEKLIENENNLFFSNYSISELANIISKVELSLSGRSGVYEKKKWLRHEGGRKIVLDELSMVIQALESWAKPLTSYPPLSTTDYLNKYNEVFLDGYDIHIGNEIFENKISYILTDDIDFNSIKNLNVITANKSKI
ncbi:hypothetical protein [Proteus mirabilis]|uniref:hypothetical protein n=1 Tax=Proteus mirabilis TaxID=584 RepID=UPI001A2657B7|nr:hypothetical protein [Proteus mirabilis]MDH7535088.1 hypothetical protein [Proteus mirabilis]MDM3630565.1 hypothetical protein [Proteus mirabilis]MDM3641658.1 hypothetical protein [Proteus mirabilis]MDM3710030.1 hypothetical protein [Proteus mirabilis]MDM3783365.1 hypothetical protein [Proteus mirabilis]